MLVIAHRGASWDEPENTLPAFERAIRDGADFVEFDVHAMRDGTLVVTHDPPRRHDVPTLEEVLGLCAGRIGVMAELKRPHLYRRHDVVRRTLLLLDDDAFVLCFEPGALREVRRLRPAVKTIQHVRWVPIRTAARYAWGVGFEDRAATPRRLAYARSLGLGTTVYTVNDPARMAELAALGVGGIFTDRPALLRETLGQARLPG